jgi:integrase
MTRPVINRPLDTVSGRRRLPPKASPYWRAIYRSLRIGWLKRPQDAGGRWVAKLAMPGNDVRQATFGAADDPPATADGIAVLTYKQAVIAAQAWAEAEKTKPKGQKRHRMSVSDGPTVEDAVKAYIAVKLRLEQTNRAGEATTVLRRFLPQSLRVLPVQGLTPEVLNVWLTQLEGYSLDGRLTQGRVDKIRGILRAALYQAKAPEAIIRQGLSAASMARREEPGTRDVIPTPAEVDRLIAAMGAIDQDLALFMSVLEVTGTRPSQLARCHREDLDVPSGFLMVPVSNKGRAGAKKAGRGVSFPIGTGLADRIARQIDRDSGLLFHTAKLVPDYSLIDRQRFTLGIIGDTWREVGRVGWNKNLWSRRVRKAVQAAGLDPAITLYTLRHHRIVLMLQGGMALREVAAFCDTSGSMIERQYARHIAGTDATTARWRRILEAEKSPPVPPATATPRLKVVA